MAGINTTTGQAEVHRALTHGGIALISNSVLTSILGLVYWLAAAHLMGRADLGTGSSLLSALWVVSALAQLNYARTLPGLLPRAHGGAARLLARAYTRVVVVSIVLGLAFAIMAPLVSTKFGYVAGVPAFALLFAVSVPLYGIFCLEDSVLATVRRAVIIPFENATFGVLKIGLLFVLVLFHSMQASMVILASWVLPLVFIIIPINIYLFRSGIPRAASTFPKDMELKEDKWIRYDFMGYIFWLLGTDLLPVVALTVLGPVSAAVFYVPFSIILAIDALSLNVGNQLTAEMSRTRGEFTVPTTRFAWRVWGGIAALSVGMIIMAPYVLDLFGAQYRSAGTTVFRVLMLAAIPRCILFLSIAAARARGVAANIPLSGPIILMLQGATCILTFVISLLAMPSQGIMGLALGWAIASTIGAVIAVFAVRPPVLPTMTKGSGEHMRKSGAFGWLARNTSDTTIGYKVGMRGDRRINQDWERE